MSETETKETAIVRCPATTPNPIGRRGHCACTLEEGHDGPHLCQSVRHHEWHDDACECSCHAEHVRFEGTTTKEADRG